jgi:hypothetical protein
MANPSKLLNRTGMSVLLILAILVGGCSLISKQTTLTLEEQQVNDIIKNANASTQTEQPRLQATGVDMHDGFIHVIVEYLKEDGSKIEGSYNVSLTVLDGIIQAEISSVDLPGLALSQKVINQIANKIAIDFAAASSQLGGRIEVLSIAVTEDRLQMVVRM